MRDARLIESREVRLGEIVEEGRLRPVSETAVASLMASIEELGTALAAVQLRRVRHREGQPLVLMAGGHRVEAYRRLGREAIRADIWDCSDDWARLAEIDDNLAHAELSVVELSQFLAERKAVYEQLHPEAKHGGLRGNQWTGGCQNDTVSFCQSISEKRGISIRHVERMVKLGGLLSPSAAAVLRRRGRPTTFRDLVELTRLEPPEQDDAAARIAEGRAQTMKEAALAARGLPSIPRARNPVDHAHTRLLELFDRAPKLAKRRFLEDVCDRYPDLVRECQDRGAPGRGAA